MKVEDRSFKVTERYKQDQKVYRCDILMPDDLNIQCLLTQILLTKTKATIALSHFRVKLSWSLNIKTAMTCI